MKQSYQALSDAIEKVELDDTPWKHALNVFNRRFSVPFIMEIANLKGSIIGESVPQVKFKFSNGKDEISIDRNQLDDLDTLSQGEKRALYLLNIIFDIEQLKESGREVLLIIDDIADSFDYKNKYAIIEYLYELAEDENFYLLILTHNYDFFRTVSSRLTVPYDNQLIAKQDKTGISLTKKEAYKEPFDRWKKEPSEKNAIALIPFIRNLIDYGLDRNISGRGKDYLYLTSLLHVKDETDYITFGDILPLYKEYAGISSFKDDIDLTQTVKKRLIMICDNLSDFDVKLEDKIILAIGIRHKAEEYMLSIIEDYNGPLWLQ